MKLAFSTTVLCSAVALAAPSLAQQQTSGHCEDGYTSADANQDAMVSQEELASANESAFADMDENDDGMVSMEEYASCQGNWATNSTTDPSTDDDFAQIDSDGDGMVTPQEFMDTVEEVAMTTTDAGSMQATSSESGTSSQSATGETGDMERILFLRRVIVIPQGYDDTRLGSMSNDEIAARASQKFETTDADGNQRLSVEEWTAAAENHMENVALFMDRTFDRIDSDGSDDLSRQEYNDAGMAQWDAARERAEQDGASTDDVGPPVVYFRYPSTM